IEARLARRTRVPAIAAIFDEHQPVPRRPRLARRLDRADHIVAIAVEKEDRLPPGRCGTIKGGKPQRSEEHTSELKSLMRHSSPVFCLKNKHMTTITYTR